VRKQRFSPFCSPSSVVPLLTARQPHAMRWVALTLRDFASFNSRICERSISCSSLLPETSLSFYKGVAGGSCCPGGATVSILGVIGVIGRPG
jgi:hypothetical protein